MALASRNELSSKRRRARMMAWTFVFMLLAAMVLPLSGYVYTAVVHAQEGERVAQQDEADGVNPRANYWRAVRESEIGITTASGPYTTTQLINTEGQEWRELRNGPIATYGAWALPLVILAIGLFYIFRGQVKLEDGRSGQKVERWSVAERTMHWYTAILFIIMAVTGLSLLFGRAALIPLLGAEGFSAWAQFSLLLHNYLGPFFSVGVLLIIISWIRYNIPNKTDLNWFKQGGGIVGDQHPSAGRMNGGEKGWFWLICTVGVVTIISGLVLDFPIFGQSRETMQTANVIHGIASMIWIAVFFGHVYIGTLGTEGAFEGMATGKVDTRWAKQHHDLWYQDVISKGTSPSGASVESALGRPPEDSVLRRHYEAARRT